MNRWTLAQSRCQNIVQPPHTRRGPAFFGADFSRTCVRFPGQVYRSRYCTPATWNLYLAQLKTNTALGGYSLVALLYQPWPESCGRAQRNCLHVLLPLRTRCVAHRFFCLSRVTEVLSQSGRRGGVSITNTKCFSIKTYLGVLDGKADLSVETCIKPNTIVPAFPLSSSTTTSSAPQPQPLAQPQPRRAPLAAAADSPPPRHVGSRHW